jgi:CSLREA domain-containing protein
MKRQPILTRVLALLLALTSLCVGPIPVAHAATITVNTTDDELNTDGDCSLREAIQAANTDTAVDGCTAGSGVDTISLPTGFYILTIAGAGENANGTGDLDITGDVTINGEYGPGNTIIQAGTNSTNGIDRVLDVHSGATVEINDVTVRFGRTPGTSGEMCGGGIRNYGTLTLNNSTVSGNTAPTCIIGNCWGGGICNKENATLTLNNSTVYYNTAASYGGGIRNRGTLTLNNSTIADNTAGLDGGGIYTAGTLTLDNSTVADNTADLGDGGGIFNAAWLTLNNSTIADNTAVYGGGIYNNGDNTVLLIMSTVADNGCAYSGGGIYNHSSVATIRLIRSTVNDNDAGMGDGGGIYNSGTLTLDNCTVSGNTSGQSGGGIYTAGTLLSLHRTTVAKNSAETDTGSGGDGGGIYVSSGAATAMNTIIGDNSDWDAQAPDCKGTLNSAGYNLVEDTTGCIFTPMTGDVTGSDPNLGALGDNGGPTWTHALQTGSPAIEHIPGGINDCQAGVSTDQRGYLRAGGAGYGGSRCEIGAYEYDTGPFLVYLPLVLRNS